MCLHSDLVLCKLRMESESQKKKKTSSKTSNVLRFYGRDERWRGEISQDSQGHSLIPLSLSKRSVRVHCRYPPSLSGIGEVRSPPLTWVIILHRTSAAHTARDAPLCPPLQMFRWNYPAVDQAVSCVSQKGLYVSLNKIPFLFFSEPSRH